MTVEENKALSRRLIEEGFNKGDMKVARQLLAPNYREHDPLLGELPPGPTAFQQSTEIYRTAFPDATCTIEDQVAAGDRVVTRWSGKGTNTGSLQGMPPTNKVVHVTGIQIDRIEGGKIAESWLEYDALGMLQQLGAVSMPGQARESGG